MIAPSHILHAGDVGRLEILDDLAQIAPVIAVRGNVDSRDQGLFDVVTLEVTFGETPALVAVMIHVGLWRTKLQREVRRLALDREAALVVCGHSHLPFLGRDGRIVVFNPGSAGPRRFGLPVTFGVITLSPEGVQLEHRDCETGRIWHPEP